LEEEPQGVSEIAGIRRTGCPREIDGRSTRRSTECPREIARKKKHRIRNSWRKTHRVYQRNSWKKHRVSQK
jgi:hypothetical protein